MQKDKRALLRRLIEAGVAAADPLNAVPPFLPPPPKGRCIVVGAGKASAAMARAVETNWPEDAPLSGLVVTRYGYDVPCTRIAIATAAHPVPDAAGEDAARAMLDLARGLSADDLVLALISGGGSSLLAYPAPGLTLADKQTVTAALLKSGARISEINCVRTHLSRIKGGRLAAAAYPARIVTLVVSDVPGDDAAIVASGPTLPDSTTSADALAVLDRYRIDAPEAVRAWLADPASESIKPDNPVFAHAEHYVVAKAANALAAVAAAAQAAGYEPLILGDAIEGEARKVASEQAALAHRCRARMGPAAPPCALISGGETTVTVTGKGRGGRNSEFLLALAIALKDAAGISAIACDSDGIDGSEDNAGAVIDPGTLARARNLGLDPEAALAANDAYGFFAALGDLVVTGPTRTNVNDIRIILID